MASPWHLAGAPEWLQSSISELQGWGLCFQTCPAPLALHQHLSGVGQSSLQACASSEKEVGWAHSRLLPTPDYWQKLGGEGR